MKCVWKLVLMIYRSTKNIRDILGIWQSVQKTDYGVIRNVIALFFCDNLKTLSITYFVVFLSCFSQLFNHKKTGSCH